MVRNWKRRVALLLAAAMVLTSNTIAFAGQTLKEGEAVLFDGEEQQGDTVTKNTVSPEDTKTVSPEGANVDPSSNTNSKDKDNDYRSEYEKEVDRLYSISPNHTIKDDPMTWGKDPVQARFTYMLFMPGLTGYKDNDFVSGNMIVNGKVVQRRALTGYDMPIMTGVSFNTIKVEGYDYYVIYCYGIDNSEFEGNYNLAMASSASQNNYYGFTPDGMPAGVFDYTPFTWYRKDGSATSNGKIIYDAAIIKWSQGKEAEKERFIVLDKLQYKYNKFATVSFNVGADGKWKKLEKNAFQKPSYQPRFWPVFKKKDSYKDVTGTRHKFSKLDKDEKKELKKAIKKINKQVKSSSNYVKFEIRRRPISGTVSSDYLNDGIPYVPYKYVSLLGDDLDFTKKGKLDKANLQFKSITYKQDKDMDEDDIDKDAEAGKSGNTSKRATGYYLTHILKMKQVKDKYKKNMTGAELEKKIMGGDFSPKTKTDIWYYTKTQKVSNYLKSGSDVRTLVAFGANNLEGAAIFASRADGSIGTGYYFSDTNYFINSEEE